MTVEGKRRVQNAVSISRQACDVVERMKIGLLHSKSRESEDVVKNGNIQIQIQAVEDYVATIEQANKMLCLSFETKLPEREELNG